jgi:catechol 2,3-dioxygenase-like lactoylglutathione lyase family enzyme
MRIHHVQIAAPAGSEEQARVFFEGILGLREIEKPENLRARGGAWFAGEGFEIHVGVEEPFRPAKKAHIALQVSGLDGLRRRLEQHGLETWEDEPLPGYRRFYSADPFGNRIEFLEPISRTARQTSS